MSWLRDHFHEHVYPAFVAAGELSSQIGKPFHIQPSEHAPKDLPTELKKLWTLCKEHNVQWAYDVREVGNFGGNSRFRESAKIHSQILKSTLDAAVVAMKAEKCSKLLLGGRDVWTLAVLCERRGIPYLFVPELSRHVARSPLSRPFLESRGFRGDELFLDTGFAGSIPRSLKTHFGTDFKFRLMSQSDVLDPKTSKVTTVVAQEDMLIDCDPMNGGPVRQVKKGELYSVKEVTKNSALKRRPNQVFPHRRMARAEALETEYLAKYWETGTVGAQRSQGHAPAIFAEWSKKPDIRRVPDPKNRQLGFTDGKEIVQVSLADAHKLCPDLYKWWLSLPDCQYDKLPQDAVTQKFASKESIQRAALLTSQLWRGIPYWKNVQPSPGSQLVNSNLSGAFGIYSDQSPYTVSSNPFIISSSGVTGVTGSVFLNNASGSGTTTTIDLSPFISPNPGMPVKIETAMCSCGPEEVCNKCSGKSNNQLKLELI
jgi:hypothetical protein